QKTQARRPQPVRGRRGPFHRFLFPKAGGRFAEWERSSRSILLPALLLSAYRSSPLPAGRASIRIYLSLTTPAPATGPSAWVGAFPRHQYAVRPKKDCPAITTPKNQMFSSFPTPKILCHAWSRTGEFGAGTCCHIPLAARRTPFSAIGPESRAHL